MLANVKTCIQQVQHLSEDFSVFFIRYVLRVSSESLDEELRFLCARNFLEVNDLLKLSINVDW